MPHASARFYVAAFMALAAAYFPVRAEQTDAPSRAATSESGPVLMFAAASLKTALDKIGKRWTAETGKSVTLSFASSSALAKQIENGAPADIYMPADPTWMDFAEQRGLIKPESRISLLGNRLVLIAPRGAPQTLKIAKDFDLAAAIGDGRLATGDPRSVPVGMYAKEALTSLGVWDQVAPKIAGTDNVRSALAFVARGEAKLGIVYKTDANSEPRVSIVDTFPDASHRPIEYPIAITAASDNANAEAFLAYLKTAPAAQVFEEEGFSVLTK